MIAATAPKELIKPHAKIQICSLDTVNQRLGKSQYDIPIPDIVIVDEAHQQRGDMAKKVFGRHDADGARRIGFTATPVDIGDMYQQLVIAGTYGDMLACNAHLPMKCFGPDRPDLSKLKPMKGGDFSSEDDRRINRVPTIIGSVYENWLKLNPMMLPTVGFAPGVAESRWFVQEFMNRGIPCAHIDGERVALVEKNGAGIYTMKEYPNDDSSRAAVLEGSKNGDFRILWNRFVLREAIDCPWFFHAITATSMGSLSTYLQATGRVQRYFPDYEYVILQDHGGNIDRHRTPDIDREWTLGCTNRSLQKEEVERRERSKGDDVEPICCPRCCAYRLSGPVCHNCGHMHDRSTRMVRQLDGTLTQQRGRIVKYKPPKTFDDYVRSALFACHSTGKSVGQAYGIAKERAKADGVEVTPLNMRFPSHGSLEWDDMVRDVFPNYDPKRK